MKATTAKQRPEDIAAVDLVASDVTDVFLDFDGTLTVSARSAFDYIIPILLELPGGTRVCDAVHESASSDVIRIS